MCLHVDRGLAGRSTKGQQGFRTEIKAEMGISIEQSSENIKVFGAKDSGLREYKSGV